MGKRGRFGQRKQVVQLNEPKQPSYGLGFRPAPAQTGHHNALSGLLSNYGQSDESEEEEEDEPDSHPSRAASGKIQFVSGKTQAGSEAAPMEPSANQLPAPASVVAAVTNGGDAVAAAAAAPGVGAGSGGKDDIDSKVLDFLAEIDAFGGDGDGTTPATPPDLTGQERSADEESEDEDLVEPEKPTTMWRHCMDETTQCYYYWNTASNDVQWTIPADYSQHLLLVREYEKKLEQHQAALAKRVKKAAGKPSVTVADGRSEAKAVSSDGNKDTTAPVAEETTADAEKPEKLVESDEMEADDRPVMGPALPPGGLPVAPDPVAPEAAVTSPMDEDVEARGPDREERLATADAARREEETDATREPGNDLEPEKVGGDSPPRARDDQVCASGDVAEADDAMDQRDTSEERGQEAEVDVQTETHPATKDAESDCEGDAASRSVAPPAGGGAQPAVEAVAPPPPPPPLPDTTEIDAALDAMLEGGTTAAAAAAPPGEGGGKAVREGPGVGDAGGRGDTPELANDDEIDKQLEMALEKKKGELRMLQRSDGAPVRAREATREDTREGTGKRKTAGDEPNVKRPKILSDYSMTSPIAKKRIEREEIKQRIDALAEIPDLSSLVMDKLDFLEVTRHGLSRLQVLLIRLETRLSDWRAGGLSSDHMLLCLREAASQLHQYEASAPPAGWSCLWDRSYKRYFYCELSTGETQWDYPETGSAESTAAAAADGAAACQQAVEPTGSDASDKSRSKETAAASPSAKVDHRKKASTSERGSMPVATPDEKREKRSPETTSSSRRRSHKSRRKHKSKRSRSRERSPKRDGEKRDVEKRDGEKRSGGSSRRHTTSRRHATPPRESKSKREKGRERVEKSTAVLDAEQASPPPPATADAATADTLPVADGTPPMDGTTLGGTAVENGATPAVVTTAVPAVVPDSQGNGTEFSAAIVSRSDDAASSARPDPPAIITDAPVDDARAVADDIDMDIDGEEMTSSSPPMRPSSYSQPAGEISAPPQAYAAVAMTAQPVAPPAAEHQIAKPTASSAHHKEKSKRKDKKLVLGGSGGRSLKKVPSLVEKWQNVQKQVERECREETLH